MPKKPKKNIITSIDIGTSKVVALIGEIKPSGEIEVIGIGRQPSQGLKRGMVVDIDTTVEAIGHALQEAEQMADCEVRTAYAGISGSHIRSLNSHGIVAIKDKEVSSADVERVIDAAKAVAIPADQKILHVLPQEFIIDNQGSIREPAGMAGVRLEARVHIVTSTVSSTQNVIKCVQRCGLEINEVILEQLASSHAVLTDDEKELGVCLLDIGGGTTDIAVFHHGAIQHTAVIPIAGDQVTNDIAMALRTPTKAAEAIKIEHGFAMPEMAPLNNMIEVLSANDRPGRQISSTTLSEVICARYEEIFSLVRNELRKTGLEDQISAGIVLAGGGARINGILKLAEQCFDASVRLGIAPEITGLPEAARDPTLTTGVGLLLHGYKLQFEDHYRGPSNQIQKNGWWTKAKTWLKGNF